MDFFILIYYILFWPAILKIWPAGPAVTITEYAFQL